MTQAIKTKLCTAGLLALLAVSTTGCQKEFSPGNSPKPEDALFGFETRATVDLAIDYGMPGFQAQFQIFAENPLLEDNGSLTLKEDAKPVFTAFTDKDGKFSAPISIPGAVKTAYLYTDRLGLSSCVPIDFSTGGASYSAKSNRSSRAASSASQMTSWFTGEAPYDITKNGAGDYAYGNTSNVHSVYKWTTNGRIIGVNPSEDVFIATTNKGGGMAAVSERTQEFLAGIDKTGKRSDLLIDTPKEANITIKEDGTTLQLTFLDERGAYANSFGYYYYKEGSYLDKANSRLYAMEIKAIQKYIVFPHAATDALAVGTTVSLKFFGENGDQPGTNEFPKGYIVGWFLFSRGFQTATNQIIPQYGIVDGLRPHDPTQYFPWGTMSTSNDLKTETNDFRRFITLFDSASKSVVIGVEDRIQATPDDFCDLSFIVTANKDLEPDGKPEIPEQPEEQPKIDDTFFGTLAFEDIWPYGGDYDMNDAVVEYKWSITFDKDNNATEVEESYTPVYNGAKYVNIFAYQQPHGSAAAPAGVTLESATNSVLFDTYMADALNKTITIKRTFSATINKEQLKDDFNPYIIVDVPKRGKGQNRTEVHLPKQTATSYVDQSLLASPNGAYYMKKDGSYPFAINIPITGFKLSPETTSIDTTYPSFRRWADSHGKTDSNWYETAPIK